MNYLAINTCTVMNIEWDYDYYQPWSDNEWLVNEMLAMLDEDVVRATGAQDSRRILSNITVYNYDTTHLQENPQRLG